MQSRFEQINVFATDPLRGNPLAVVHCQANAFSTQTMQAFARWTQLSETVFISPASDPRADYQVRIFTPTGELPFAGHPTLGSCHSWLDGKKQAVIIQQSAIGLVEIRQIEDQLFFKAPPLIEQRAFSAKELECSLAATGLSAEDVMATCVLSNGPVWHCIVVKSVESLMKVNANFSAMADLKIGICSYADLDNALVVRAFMGDEAVEDPVTGSLQAVLAQWLIKAGKMSNHYHAQQGACVGAAGEVEIKEIEGDIYIGGHSTVVIRGEVSLAVDNAE